MPIGLVSRWWRRWVLVFSPSWVVPVLTWQLLLHLLLDPFLPSSTHAIILRARRARAAGAAELLMSLSANSCVQAMADVVRFDSSFGDDRFCSHRLVNWFRMPNFLMTNWVLAGTVLVLPVFHFRFSRSWNENCNLEQGSVHYVSSLYLGLVMLWCWVSRTKLGFI